MQTIETHIENIKAGDAVVHEGKVMTVSGSDIKRCDFMGMSIFGDTYRLGYKPVTKLVFPVQS